MTQIRKVLKSHRGKVSIIVLCMNYNEAIRRMVITGRVHGLSFQLYIYKHIHITYTYICIYMNCDKNVFKDLENFDGKFSKYLLKE